MRKNYERPKYININSDACRVYYHIVNTFLKSRYKRALHVLKESNKKVADQALKMTHFQCSRFFQREEKTGKYQQKQTHFENKTQINRSSCYGNKAAFYCCIVFLTVSEFSICRRGHIDCLFVLVNRLRFYGRSYA